MFCIKVQATPAKGGEAGESQESLLSSRQMKGEKDRGQMKCAKSTFTSYV